MTEESKSNKLFKDWKMQMWLGRKSYEQGKYMVAAEKFHKALNDLETAAVHDECLAVTLNNLALCYCAQGKHKEADPLYQRALSIDQSSGSASKLMLAEDFSNIASHYRKQDMYAQAETLYQQALNIWKKELGEDSAEVARCLNNLGMLYSEQDRSEAALEHFKKALTIKETIYGSRSKEYAETLVNLAATYCGLNRCEEADPLFDKGIQILEYSIDPIHSELIDAMEAYLIHLRKVGRTEKAQEVESDIETFKKRAARMRQREQRQA